MTNPAISFNLEKRTIRLREAQRIDKKVRIGDAVFVSFYPPTLTLDPNATLVLFKVVK